METRNTLPRLLAAALSAVILVASAATAEVRPATAHGCPLRFDQQTTGLQRTCLFVGHFAGSDRQLLAAFAGDGSAVVVAIARDDATPLLYLPAEVESATSGTLLRWEAGVEPTTATAIATGTLTLEDGGRRLRVRAVRAAGQDGPPAEFVGHFATMVSAAETVLSQR